MYVTRPLSLYKRDASALTLQNPDGPNSGVLVIQDEESLTRACCGLCKNVQLKDLPFPQNKDLTVWFPVFEGVEMFSVAFIPVINQPLSSNRYYAIELSGKHQGKAHVNSMEEDKKTCCFCSYVPDKKPVPLDVNDINQQFEISKRKRSDFVAKSVSGDGFPPEFLRTKGWLLETSSKHKLNLTEAAGLNSKLRARHPDFNFSLSEPNSERVVVGKWYSPFMFIKEGSLKDQVKDSRYYEITLEQSWEQIFACEKTNNSGHSIAVDVAVKAEVVAVSGKKAEIDERLADGVVWFRSIGNARKDESVGLSSAIVERMKWEQEKAGWVGGSDGEVRVKREEKYGGEGEWGRFGCYVLCEKYVVKRMDGRLVMTYEFKHANQLRCKWE